MQTDSKWLTRPVLFIVVLIILLAESVCGFYVHHLSVQREAIKKDYALVNNVTFGLLSVDQWRDKASAVINHQIKDFELTPQQRDELQKEIAQLLYTMVDRMDSLMNRPKKSLGGKLKKIVYHTLVKKKELNKQVPGFAKQITDKIQQPSSMSRIKNVLESKTKQLEKQTYDSTKHARETTLQRTFHKYGTTNKADFEKKSKVLLTSLQHQTYAFAFGTLATIITMLLLWRLLRNRKDLHPLFFTLSIISALILLLVGLTTTMIEVDARISELNFELLGEQVKFSNQVLFYQSKSILDVVVVLIGTGKYDAMTVGVLILCFSIFFPIAKLVCTGIILFNPAKWSKNKFVEFFAIRSGKWSMADVMVVAILMAYIGFNGIIYNAMQGLNIHSGGLTSITTNRTSLRPGYIVFTGFVFYSLVLSKILKRIVHIPHN